MWGLTSFGQYTMNHDVIKLFIPLSQISPNYQNTSKLAIDTQHPVFICSFDGLKNHLVSLPIFSNSLEFYPFCESLLIISDDHLIRNFFCKSKPLNCCVCHRRIAFDGHYMSIFCSFCSVCVCQICAQFMDIIVSDTQI